MENSFTIVVFTELTKPVPNVDIADSCPTKTRAVTTPSEPTKAWTSPTRISLTSHPKPPRLTSHHRNYGVPRKSNGPGPPSPISGPPLRPTPFINKGRSSGMNYPTTLIPWSGTSCGSTSIGSSPSIPKDHALSTFTPPFSYPFNPSKGCGCSCTVSSTRPSPMRSFHASSPSNSESASISSHSNNCKAPSPTPSIPTRSP